MVSRLTELTKLLSEAQAKRVRAESKVGSVDNRKSGDSSLLDDETVKDLRTKLKDAESEYSALSRLVTGEYPKLVELRGRIDSLRKTVHEERGVNLAALKTEYESNLAAEKMLVQQFKEELNKAHEMSTQLIQYNLLQRDATLLRDLTQSVLKALNETEISASSVNSNVFVSDYAPLPRIPSAPRRNIIVVFSLMLGLVAGVALAVLREVIDSTIRVSDDAQAALGLPTLGIIPSFKALGATNLMESEEGLRGKIAGLLPYIRRLPNLPRLPFLKRDDHGPTSNADETYDASSEQDSDESMIYPSISSEDPIVRDEIESVKESQPAEAHTTLNGTVPVFPTMPPGMLALPEAGVLDALRTLRANILFSSTQNVSRVIMVASGREREGKTSVISNLAVTFARASQKTLLIDGDLRRPKIARRFGIPAENFGLVDFLAGQADLEEILVPSAVSNLMVIPAGSSTLNPTELLGSEKMVALIAVLRERFDVILLDAAPVLPVADALILAQHAETVIFVVRSGRTEKAVAQEAVRRLRRVGARVRGLVLNDFDPGAGDYSSDRYSVSHYTVIDATSIPVAQNGAAPGGFTPDDSRRAVG
jgi:capsular exopolysaccharide synthesis family protein